MLTLTGCIPPVGSLFYLWNPLLSSSAASAPTRLPSHPPYSPSFPFRTTSATQITASSVCLGYNLQPTLFIRVLVLFFISSGGDAFWGWRILAAGSHNLLLLFPFFPCSHLAFFWCFQFLLRFQFSSLQSSMPPEQTNPQFSGRWAIALNRGGILNLLFVFLSGWCRMCPPSIVNISSVAIIMLWVFLWAWGRRFLLVFWVWASQNHFCCLTWKFQAMCSLLIILLNPKLMRINADRWWTEEWKTSAHCLIWWYEFHRLSITNHLASLMTYL